MKKIAGFLMLAGLTCLNTPLLSAPPGVDNFQQAPKGTQSKAPLKPTTIPKGAESGISGTFIGITSLAVLPIAAIVVAAVAGGVVAGTTNASGKNVSTGGTNH